MGRFTTVDPVYTWRENLVDPQRWNRYAYVRNNPIKYTDPDGKVLRLAQGSSPQFQRDFATDVRYLNGAGASGLIAELERRPELITIRQAGLGLDEYDHNVRETSWNPRGGVETPSGGRQSPALGFVHESAHAVQDLKNHKQYVSDLARRDPAFDTAEEKRVILGPESRAAKRLGEAVRKEHNQSKDVVVSAPDKVR